MPKTVALAAIAAIVSLLLSSGAAFGHAVLVSTDPGNEARLESSPRSVSLEFSESVANPAFVAITAPDGSSVKVTQVRSLDKKVTAQAAPSDMKGTYTLAYRVVSSDGHPVEGSTTFNVTSGRTVSQVAANDNETFLHRHTSHLLWGLGGVVIAVGLLLWPLRAKND